MADRWRVTKKETKNKIDNKQAVGFVKGDEKYTKVGTRDLQSIMLKARKQRRILLLFPTFLDFNTEFYTLILKTWDRILITAR